MINRQNYHDVRVYLHHLEKRQLDPDTVKRARSHLRHLLEWADETPLTKARAIDPAFPSYLITARADGQDKSLAPASITKCLANARQFFNYAHQEWGLRYKSITPSWIELLQPPRHLRQSARLSIREYWSLEAAQKIASVAVETLREQRGQVAVCMLYLSGMRAEALASLPIRCVDLQNNQISQLPEVGVKTKNRKAALTYLLQISPLLDIVKQWDALVRPQMPPESLWYANLSSDGMRLLQTNRARHQRHTTVEDDVRLICERANVPYLSPHKLRHGHAVYGLKNARTIEELKAVSQNIMHASMTITDGIYAKLLDDEVRTVITSLGNKSPADSSGTDKQKVLAQIAELMAQL